MAKQNEWNSKDDLVNYLNQSNEALRTENLRLMDENERLINNIEVIDAEYISNQPMANYYGFINTFTQSLKNN